MKRLLTISIILSFATIGALQVTGWLTSRTKNQTGPLSTRTVQLRLTEIARHDQPADCWLIIDQDVYNVSGYLDAHPGLADSILPYCGRDGSSGFATKDQGQSHSNTARRLLANFRLGALNETTTENRITATSTTAGTPEASE